MEIPTAQVTLLEKDGFAVFELEFHLIDPDRDPGGVLLPPILPTGEATRPPRSMA